MGFETFVWQVVPSAPEAESLKQLFPFGTNGSAGLVQKSRRQLRYEARSHDEAHETRPNLPIASPLVAFESVMS